LNAGTPYTFTFSATGAAAKLLLFRSGAGVYWAGRNSALFEVTSSTSYTPASSGYYGVVVINDDGASGSFSVGVGACVTPTVLTAGTSVTTSGLAERYYTFHQSASYWSAIGVRGSSDWNLETLSSPSGGAYPVCMSGQIASS